MTMPRLPYLLAPVAAAVAATAAFALPASGDDDTATAIAAARDAFPALATTISNGPTIPVTLAAGDREATVVGQGTLTDGAPDRTLTLTSNGMACLTVDDSSTCLPAELAAEDGLYLAETACDPEATVVHGVVPDGVDEAAAVGADEPATDEAATDGSVTLTFDGDDLDGIQLDGGAVVGPAFSSICVPTQP